MKDCTYFDEVPVAVTVCDSKGIILYMNSKSFTTFTKDGGSDLVGKSVFDCHPEPARGKLQALLDSQATNSYTIEKDGKKKLIHQTPWFEGGELMGMIEFSFEIPAELPNFKRG
jgi:transcriptional regulator with PAS, ATPase and Fis domain